MEDLKCRGTTSRGAACGAGTHRATGAGFLGEGRGLHEKKGNGAEAEFGQRCAHEAAKHKHLLGDWSRGSPRWLSSINKCLGNKAACLAISGSEYALSIAGAGGP